LALDELINRAVPSARAQMAPGHGYPVVTVQPAAVAAVLEFLRDDADQRYEMLVDVTAVDFTPVSGSLQVVYQLRSLTRNVRLTVKAVVPATQPELPSVAGLWKSANWAEREVWDMFGVRFTHHPDLRRILMYPEFVGHPLLKSYPVDRRQPLIEERDPIADPWPSRDGL
jgi:NADH-quinone oxidoreductase subunit C